MQNPNEKKQPSPGLLKLRNALKNRFPAAEHDKSIPSPTESYQRVAPNFGFVFDLDLLSGTDPNSLRACSAIQQLSANEIPYVIVTSTQSKGSESDQKRELEQMLMVSLTANQIVQAYTPFREISGRYEGKTVLAIGGFGNEIREAAQAYGFNDVVTIADLIIANLVEFLDLTDAECSYYKEYACEVTRFEDSEFPRGVVRIDAILVFGQPRDWRYDIQVLISLILSQQGVLGSMSAKNGNPALPNCGYQQDGQPHVYFANQSIFEDFQANLVSLIPPQLRQAILRNAGTDEMEVRFEKTIFGRQAAFECAEATLIRQRSELKAEDIKGLCWFPPLSRIYMVVAMDGDMDFVSPGGINWCSIYIDGKSAGGATQTQPNRPTNQIQPRCSMQDVFQAIRWVLRKEAYVWEWTGTGRRTAPYLFSPEDESKKWDEWV
jgi:hypothetical protein